MRVTHRIGKEETKSTGRNVSFFLTNKAGGFLQLFNSTATKYNGFFIEKDGIIYKTLEDIELISSTEVKEVINFGSYFKRKKTDNEETFFMPHNLNSFSYELEESGVIRLFFDCRKIFDSRVWGLNYKIEEIDGLTLISFTKRTHQNEDPSHDEEEFTIYTAIISDQKGHKDISEWKKKSFYFDMERGEDSERFVFESATLFGKKFVVSSGFDKNATIEEAQKVFRTLASLKKNHKMPPKTGEPAFVCARKSLYDLIIKDNVYAGLPWFTQFWGRDSAISAKAIADFDKKAAKKILFNRLNTLNENGQAKNVKNAYYGGNELGTADATGWIFFRLSQMSLSASEKKKVAKLLTGTIENIRKVYEREGLIWNGPKETWMDTDGGIEDHREGFRIEIQALMLSMYHFAYKLTKESKYKKYEKQLVARVRKEFWNKKYLNDGVNDRTIRPNLFIAAYVYPEILSKKEWEKCISNVLKALWLDWGGISSIDVNNPIFQPVYTGVNDVSYHRGDSWYWINFLSAIVMKRINAKKFHSYIKAIYDAGKNEILWMGAVGSCAELSHAKYQKPAGAYDQAWSNALFIELSRELGN